MSNLINKTGLKKFADGFWTKIKGRYDVAFKGVTLTDDKELKFTKIVGTDTVDVSLEKYARLQDRNEFEQDVSADNVAVIDNSGIGARSTHTSKNRGLGFRQLTTKAFKDGYVSHIKIYMDNRLQANTATTWKVWAITKGGTDKNGDRVKEVVLAQNLNVQAVQEGGQEKKIVEIPVNKSFEKETYFIVRCNQDVLVATDIKPEYEDDVVNLNNIQPPDTVDSPIDWVAGVNSKGNTAIMYLYGRESIGSLSLKLRQTQADGSKYVLKSETTATGGTGNENKVVKLDEQGKLSESMLPAIALNEFFSVTAATWNEAALSGTTYQNGDIIYHTNTQKRYLCINKNETFENRFVELNSKDGVVQSVNGKVGAITLGLEATDDKFKLNITSGGSTVATEVNIISDDEITAILNALPQ